MNDVASTSLVTVRRPSTMLPYAFKQSLEDLETMGFVAIAHVGGDECIVERQPHALGLSALLVQLDHERRAKLPITEKPSVSKDVSSIAPNESRLEERPAVSEQGPRPPAFNRGGPAASSRSMPSRASSKAAHAKNRGRLAADAQAGSPFSHVSAGKVRSPGPRTGVQSSRRVVMRAPRERSQVSRKRAIPSEVKHVVVRGEQSRASQLRQTKKVKAARSAGRKERFVMPVIRLADIERVRRGYVAHVALPNADALRAFAKMLRGAR